MATAKVMIETKGIDVSESEEIEDKKKGPDPEIDWRCLECLNINHTQGEAPPIGPWSCENCSNTEEAHPRALDAEGNIVRCPACDCPDIYRHRDFNRRLGLAIVVVGVALAWHTNYISIFVCAIIDLIIYMSVKDCVVCYHCQAVMHNYPGTSEVEHFDLNISDKYIELERERGW